jgi:hypothetical protein
MMAFCLIHIGTTLHGSEFPGTAAKWRMIEVMSFGVDKAAKDPTAWEALWVRVPLNIQNNTIHCGFFGSRFHSSDEWQFSGLMRSGCNFASCYGRGPSYQIMGGGGWHQPLIYTTIRLSLFVLQRKLSLPVCRSSLSLWPINNDGLCFV